MLLSDEAAGKVFERIWTPESTGIIADGKVLTRYAVQLNGRELLVLRTQSFLVPSVNSFFDSFTKEASSIVK